MPSQAPADVFEDLLHLEEQYYRQGYDLGVADGSTSGRIEGRVFGLEKGFERFVEMGKLNGQATVWEARLLPPPAETNTDQMLPPPAETNTAQIAPREQFAIAPLRGSERLRKHIQRLATLTHPPTVGTENTEDAVGEFDDRLKDARAKATLIAKMVGHDEKAPGAMHDDATPTGKARRARASSVAASRTGEMEDFRGPLPRRS